MTRKILLYCGVLSSLLYIGMNVFIPMFYEGYSSLSFTVSELSAIGAPTRPIWVLWSIVYGALLLAFGWGVWKFSAQSRALRFAGIFMMVHAIVGFFWPPMHTREVLASGGGTLTDDLHIAWTAITVPLMMLEIGFGAAAFGKSFRWYSGVSIVLMIAGGILTGLDSPAMEQNLPTPWMGFWERVGIAAFMVWIIVFAGMIISRKAYSPLSHTPHHVGAKRSPG